MNCVNCKNEIISKSAKKFCSCSCAAKFNNTGRIRTDESKLRVSIAMKIYLADNPCELKSRTNRLEVIRPIKKRKTETLKICTFCKCEFMSQRRKNGAYPRLCSDKCFIARKQQNARGNKSIFYKDVRMDSMWEVKLATFLDYHNIEWVRPQTSIPWTDTKQKQHKYFPDFYLPAYNIYCDPKNPIVLEQQKEKIEYVKKHITLLYGDLNEIINHIKNMVGLPEFESGINHS